MGGREFFITASNETASFLYKNSNLPLCLLQTVVSNGFSVSLAGTEAGTIYCDMQENGVNKTPPSCPAQNLRQFCYNFDLPMLRCWAHEGVEKMPGAIRSACLSVPARSTVPFTAVCSKQSGKL